mmetsp:Transcript_65122/g.76496  ORF Transcript_65122/g.76496 Transcript_65122/m.76496 type:complete len:166 (+) Transcript_65122:58-555(+)|eukprot:CAMPEP_0194373042 /NCGR_PEP_ID=MMETSP0174-20130528/21460_1 /TAXON_ID=216777 /ORGANISM="Proboscia alata, Strain PI-D3" /LENGTH=165 /DNA_ID=CAMNT_0039151893 /DNA_START=73 /DNA_END=570 /DNA_ORIENTATION=-
MIAEILDKYGLDPIQVGVALVAIIAAAVFFLRGDSETEEEGKIELHPDHVEFMKKKEEEHCSGNFGKGLRCIFDFLREEPDDVTKKVFAEKSKYSEGFELYAVDIHPAQFDWFEEKGVTVSTTEGEEYKEISRVSRACLDWAMRHEAEGNSQDEVVYEIIRCLNC